MRAASEFAIDEIIAHQGTYRDRDNLEYLVSWTGYPGEDTWEKYKTLLGTTKLDAYNASHKMRALLPKNYVG